MSRYSKLVVFGCSFTKYRDTNTWSHFLSQKMGVECDNYGRRGCSNHFILNEIVNRLPQYESENPLVIVQITQALRMSVFSDTILTFDDRPDKLSEAFLSQIYSIQSVLESFGVDWEMFAGTEPYPRTINNKDIIKHFIRSDIQERLYRENMIGFPFFKEIGGKTLFTWNEKNDSDYFYSKDDIHPSDKAHEEWANFLGAQCLL